MIKSNKGITLTSLVIYVIVLMIVIALFSSFSRYFYKNVNQIAIKEENNEQYTRFLAYLTKDINQKDITFVKTGSNDGECYIIFKYENNIEHQYLYKNKTIYYINTNKIKKIVLCDNVNSCEFNYDDSTKTLTLNLNIEDKQYRKTFNINTNIWYWKYCLNLDIILYLMLKRFNNKKYYY